MVVTVEVVEVVAVVVVFVVVEVEVVVVEVVVSTPAMLDALLPDEPPVRVNTTAQTMMMQTSKVTKIPLIMRRRFVSKPHIVGSCTRPRLTLPPLIAARRTGSK